MENMRTRRYMCCLVVLTVLNFPITYIWIRLLNSPKANDDPAQRSQQLDSLKEYGIAGGSNNLTEGYRRHNDPRDGQKSVLSDREEKRGVLAEAMRHINNTLIGIDDVKVLLKEHHDEQQDFLKKILDLSVKQQRSVNDDKAPYNDRMADGHGNQAGEKETVHVNVLVMASMRTGSSFVGELFKQNPEFIYIFEPLRALKLDDNDPMLPVLGIEMLEDIYRCNFTTKPTKDFLARLYNPRIKPGKRDIVRAWVDQLVDAGESCDYGDHSCFIMTPKHASESCEGFRHRGIKSIRIQDLNLVVYLMNLADIRLKVINVLRDPRAMMASVIPLYRSNYNKASRKATHYTLTKAHMDDALRLRLNTYCSSMMRNFLLGTKGTWMPRERYLPLRYEDMAAAPFDVAREIFDFLGVKLHENVIKWLEKNTVADMKADHALYAYKTTRNSTVASQAWRTRMTFDLAKEIENTGDCGRFMDLLRYRKVESEELLKNVSFPLTL